MITKERLAEIMTIIEGYKTEVYRCSMGHRTIAFGFNMDKPGARGDWGRLGIVEDFDEVLGGASICYETAEVLLMDFWDNYCIPAVKRRCEALGEDYGALPEWHQFILADIVYNIGNINGWTAVIRHKEPLAVLAEARRKPNKIMDSRVCKIGKFFDLIDTIQDCIDIGLEYTKYTK